MEFLIALKLQMTTTLGRAEVGLFELTELALGGRICFIASRMNRFSGMNHGGCHVSDSRSGDEQRTEVSKP